jgi:hypothetical protein
LISVLCGIEKGLLLPTAFGVYLDPFRRADEVSYIIECHLTHHHFKDFERQSLHGELGRLEFKSVGVRRWLKTD